MLLDKVTGKELTPPREVQKYVPVDLDAICRKCLTKSPRRRYKNGAELAADLGRFLDGYPVQALTVSAAGRLRRWIKRRPLTAALWLLAVIAVASTLTAYWIGKSKVDPKGARDPYGLPGSPRR